MRTAFFNLGGRFYYIRYSCYGDLDELDLDGEEINILLYDLKTKSVLSAELEDINAPTLRKQLYNLKVGLGKKLRLGRVESFLQSYDCDVQESAKPVEPVDIDL